MSKTRAEAILEVGGLKIKAPFHKPFVEWLKANVPPMHRGYNPKDNQWFIYSEFAPRVYKNLSQFFSVIEDDTRENWTDGWDPDKYSKRGDPYEEARKAHQQAYNKKRYNSQDPGAKHTYEAPPPPPKPFQTKRDKAFATLHLLPTAPGVVVKAAYRALSMANHPDKNPDDRDGATTRMKDINSAYTLIK